MGTLMNSVVKNDSLNAHAWFDEDILREEFEQLNLTMPPTPRYMREFKRILREETEQYRQECPSGDLYANWRTGEETREKREEDVA